MDDIEALARKLYDACPTVKPEWRQLGDVTKQVWREEAQRRAADTSAVAAPIQAVNTEPQGSLF